jgi:AraC-like DNA-binding protein
MIIWNSDKANSASPCYRKPDADSLYQAEQAMLKHLEMFLKANGYDFDSLDVDVDRELLNRAFVRVDKRLDYYRIYHNDTYLNEVRVNHALDDYLTHDVPVCEAALKNGFGHYNHFTNACRKYYGASPTAIKKQKRAASVSAPLERSA